MCQAANRLISSDGETEVIERFIKRGAVVFDVGANVGDWSAMLLQIQPELTVHSFEPVPATHGELARNLAPQIRHGVVVPNCCGVGRSVGERSFTFYQDASTWSSFYRRERVEKEAGIKQAVEMSVPVTTIDAYCAERGVRRIDFLKVDTEGGELDVLLGARQMLKWGRIDHIQFEYGGTYLDAGITLRQVFDLMEANHYGIFKILPGQLEYCPSFRDVYEDYQYANFLAVNERLVSSYLGHPPKMLNLRALLLKNRVRPRGIIHIGAHEGAELEQYRAMGAEKVLFVEANPATFDRLVQNIGNTEGVMAVQCAISDHDGSVTLHVTSMDQSSSILELKRHKELYPGIVEESAVTVPCRTLDSLLAELRLDPADFNVMNIDIQGAELLALTGAEQALRHIEAINSEINYEELYAGCALIDDLDAFLDQRGFDRVATVTPWHPSWGDGFYVKRPVVAMSTLGSNGRFANQVFQYAFLRLYAYRNLLSYETPPWIGQALFGANDPPLSGALPLVQETSNLLPEALFPNSNETFRSVDLWGYFQYHTSYYAPHKELFRSLFEPVPALKAALESGYAKLKARGNTVVGLHLRRGDYGYDYFFVAENRWYLEWLAQIWPTLDNPVLFIASDEPDRVLADFAAYHPVTSRDLGLELGGAEFYPDFYLLSRCDLTAISNSSFSFAACMLNRTGRAFLRPSLSEKRLIQFDPWDSEVLLRDATVEAEAERELQQVRQPPAAATGAAATTVQQAGTPVQQPQSGTPVQQAQTGAALQQPQSGTPVQPAQNGAAAPSIMFLNVYYTGFLAHVYTEKFPGLAEQSYAIQKRLLIGEMFGDSDFYTHNLALAGWRTEDVIVNAPAQVAWAREQGLAGEGLDLVLAQIRQMRPEVLYIQDMYAYPKAFLDCAREVVKMVVGQIASPMVPGTPFEAYDLVVSSFPHFVERFSQAGINSVYQPLSFEPRVLSQVPRFAYQERPIPCSFVGGISPLHTKGNQLLEALIEKTPIEIWGYGAQGLPPESPILTRHRGEAWGKTMYSILASSKITINRHIDVAENHANNLRMYEATGSGALLLTDYKDDLEQLFAIGTEVVAYRSPEECSELVRYYLAHPEEARAIAEAGQRRTLTDHCYRVRMERISALLRRHINSSARVTP